MLGPRAAEPILAILGASEPSLQRKRGFWSRNIGAAALAQESGQQGSLARGTAKRVGQRRSAAIRTGLR